MTAVASSQRLKSRGKISALRYTIAIIGLWYTMSVGGQQVTLCGPVRYSGGTKSAPDNLVNNWIYYRESDICYDLFDPDHKPIRMPGERESRGFITIQDIVPAGSFDCVQLCGNCTGSEPVFSQKIETRLGIPVADGSNGTTNKRDIEHPSNGIGWGGFEALQCGFLRYPNGYRADAQSDPRLCPYLTYGCYLNSNGIDVTPTLKLELCQYAAQFNFDYDSICFKAYNQYLCMLVTKMFQQYSGYVRNGTSETIDGRTTIRHDLTAEVCPTTICDNRALFDECAAYTGGPGYYQWLFDPAKDFCTDLGNAEQCPDGYQYIPNVDADVGIRPGHTCHKICTTQECSSGECVTYDTDLLIFVADGADGTDGTDGTNGTDGNVGGDGSSDVARRMSFWTRYLGFGRE